MVSPPHILSLSHGDHACALYTSEEERATMAVDFLLWD
jgi:hypothetical protein